MLKTFLRHVHNTLVRLAVGILAVGLFYLGGAALLALTFAGLMAIGPSMASYVFYVSDAQEVPALLFAGLAAAVMLAVGAMLARPIAWTLDKLDNVQRRFSFS